MMDSPQAWGQSLFCDDIRFELGGKITLVGIYTSEMVFQTNFPNTMTKLAIFIRYYELLGFSAEDLKVKIFIPGDEQVPLMEIPILRSNISQGQQVDLPGFKEEGMKKYLTIGLPIIISPFNIKEEGNVRVRIQNGEHIIRAGAVGIRKMREGEVLPSPGFST